MWIVYAGLILLLFVSFGAENEVWKPIRYITFGILSILFLIIGFEWWVYAVAFSLAALIAIKVYADEHGKNIWTKLFTTTFVVVIVASAGVTIADYAVTQSVAKADSRLQKMQEAFSYDYSVNIDSFTRVENGFRVEKYPEPYIRYFVDATNGNPVKTLKNPKYSGMFINDGIMANINTVAVVVRRHGSGHTYDVYQNGVKTNRTKAIYQQVVDIYFFNLDTHEYTYINGVVSGQMPNKKGGGVTSVSKAKAFRALKSIYN